MRWDILFEFFAILFFFKGVERIITVRQEGRPSRAIEPIYDVVMREALINVSGAKGFAVTRGHETLRLENERVAILLQCRRREGGVLAYELQCETAEHNLKVLLVDNEVTVWEENKKVLSAAERSDWECLLARRIFLRAVSVGKVFEAA